jgi:hypothetical protein
MSRKSKVEEDTSHDTEATRRGVSGTKGTTPEKNAPRGAIVFSPFPGPHCPWSPGAFSGSQALEEAYVPFFGAFGAAWDEAMVAGQSANPVGCSGRRWMPHS